MPHDDSAAATPVAGEGAAVLLRISEALERLAPKPARRPEITAADAFVW